MASISEWPTKDATRFASLMHARGCDLNAVNEWGNSAVSLALYYGTPCRAFLAGAGCPYLGR